jgi:DNA replication protein DnaC
MAQPGRLPVNLETIKTLINPPGDELPAEKVAELRGHYAEVAKRHGMALTSPLKHVIHNAPELYARAKGYRDGRHGVSMFGSCGTGKTVATGFLSYIYATLHLRVEMVVAPVIGQLFSCGGDKAFWARVEEFTACPLIIDDLGSERQAKSYGNSDPFGEWIMARYAAWQRGGPETHITGNLTTAMFIERYGERVYDRVKEFTRPAQFTGASMRGQSTIERAGL